LHGINVIKLFRDNTRYDNVVIVMMVVMIIILLVLLVLLMMMMMMIIIIIIIIILIMFSFVWKCLSPIVKSIAIIAVYMRQVTDI